jgi:hypothetical protein
MATNEIRHYDGRAVTPQHVLHIVVETETNKILLNSDSQYSKHFPLRNIISALSLRQTTLYTTHDARRSSPGGRLDNIICWQRWGCNRTTAILHLI